METSPGMPEKTLLLVADDCPVCTDVKENVFKKALQEGKLELVRDGTDKAREVAKQLNIRSVPECVLEKDGKYSICSIDALVQKAKAGKL
jgi:thioredoxin-like negative regulator of GroEL